MKKLLSFLMFTAVLAVLASCGKSEPRTVAEKALQCAIDEDYRGYFDCVYFPADKQEQKEAYVSIGAKKRQAAREL